MFFNSLSYSVFLVTAVGVYWLLPKGRRSWLLLASIVFYGFWKVEFLILIVFSAFVDFYVAMRIHDAVSRRARECWLIASLAVNLGLLVYFKYSYFLADTAVMLGSILGLNWVIPVWKITLPLGISFYTFVTLSYTLDVYRRLIDPVRDFGTYLTYVMFWPHMIAGPILRGHELITQLQRRHRFSVGNVVAGTKLIIMGLFLKVVLADRISPLVDNAFSTRTQTLGGIDVWTMAFLFGFQIYFDFAGYSMIAVGSARVLGIHFPDNFYWPYLAASPREFWKRWHITLSSWVRDYLYLPLSGARYRDRSDGGIDVQVEDGQASPTRLSIALFLSWFLMGLWHGASWNFAFWGLWHGSLIYLYRVTRRWHDKFGSRAGAILGWCFTLLAVMLGWIPFRAETLRQTMELYAKIVDPRSYLHLSFRESFYLYAFLILVGMLICSCWRRLHHTFLEHTALGKAAETVALGVMMYFVFIYLKPVSQFIYFQF